MVKKTKKSGFVSRMLKHGGREAFDAHRADDTKHSGELPAGITGGVACLYECRIGQFKKGANIGEDFFHARGVIKEPIEHSGVHVEGRHTSITEALCDTPRQVRKTVEEHFNHVLNELRKLGLDTSEVSLGDLEGVMESLAGQDIHFRFRTWKGPKQTSGPYKDLEPRTLEFWDGACEYEESEESEGVVDNTSDVEEEEDEQNLIELGEQADRDDERARVTLAQEAESVGLDPDEYETWAELAEAISPDTTGEDEELAVASTGMAEEEEATDEEEEEEEEEESPAPEKGEVRFFRPPKKRKTVECECTAVFFKKETCNLRNLDDNTVYKGVPWDRLEDA